MRRVGDLFLAIGFVSALANVAVPFVTGSSVVWFSLLAVTTVAVAVSYTCERRCRRAALALRLARCRPGEARRARDTHPYGHAPGTIHPDPLVTHWRNPR